MVDILDQQVGLESFAGPGHWNDPDMMEVGNGGMTSPEYRAHFSFWALLAAPLIAGNDVRSMSADTKDILENKEVIAIDQDPLGREGWRISKQGEVEGWGRPLKDGGRAVILFNRGTADAEVSVTWEQLAYPGHLSTKVRDLWEHKDLGSFDGGYKAKVAPHSVVMLKVLP
jgi:alpha-galactosidase